jgi:ubiquitin carboxyl-terminal hydrolase 8
MNILFHGSLADVLTQQYTSHIHGKDIRGRRKPAYEIFGGNAQQDAQEFLSYLLEVLDDETNLHRDRDSKIDEIPDDDPRSILYTAIQYWQVFTAKNSSIITKYWRGLQMNVGKCPQCHYLTKLCTPFDITQCTILPKRTLQASLEEDVKEDLLGDFWCTRCKAAGRGTVRRALKMSLCRLPDCLAFQIRRFNADGTKKDKSRFEFPIRDLDMEPYWIPASERHIPETDKEALATAATDRHFRPPFKYDCYAVVCHIGETPRSGHYIAYVRDQTSNDPTAWIKFDDTRVTPVKIGSGGRDETELLYGGGRQDQQAYLLFYQRKGA